MVGDPPSVDKLLQRQVRMWEPEEHRPVLSMTRSAYKTYSTYVKSYISICNELGADLSQHEEQDIAMAARGSVKMNVSRPSMPIFHYRTYSNLNWDPSGSQLCTSHCT